MPSSNDAGQRRPVAGQARVERFEVRLAVIEGSLATDRGPHGPTFGVGERQFADEIEQGRHHVNEPHRIGEDARADTRRRPHDERHPQRRIVGKQPVRPLAVLAERLAMIRCKHDQGIRQRLRCA